MRIKYALLSYVSSVIVVSSIIQVGCGDSDSMSGFEKTTSYTPYKETPKESVVITGEANYVGPTDTLPDEGKVTVGGETINIPEDQLCKDPNAKMDVITVDGKVVDVICYPPATTENTTEVTASKGDTEIPQNANNTVVTFDEATDGESIPGDISVDGNNVAIYGNGPDKTIIEGDLVIAGNNARVRGLRIKGNVILDLNNTALLFCIVEGDIEINKNNITVAATDVFGNMIVKGNNAVLVQNRVQGEWTIEGSEEFCDGNSSFKDKDDDFVVDSGEVADALSCE
jgi:hypothetical protein